MISCSGPAHKKFFTSVVIINGRKYKTGSGPTKKESEQDASKNTLEVLNQIAPVLPNPPVPLEVFVDISAN